ncbi:MAG TPA: GPP34 family phosphoprotein [Micromonosporaceae bacterium]
MTRRRRVFPSTDPLDPEVRLTLRSELFLLAHDDETGREHLDRRSLCLGLAGTVLLELSLEQRILIGKSYVIRDGAYTHDPGRITITDPERYGDPLTDAAINLLKRTGGPTYVTDFIREFASLNLYDRVRGDLLATGVLHRTTYRRFGMLRKKDRYLAVKPDWAVRARTRLRKLPNPRNRTDPIPDFADMQSVALAALVTGLGLTRNLFHPEPAQLHARLMDMITRLYDDTTRDVQAAITPANRRHVR